VYLEDVTKNTISAKRCLKDLENDGELSRYSKYVTQKGRLHFTLVCLLKELIGERINLKGFMLNCKDRHVFLDTFC
jgi:hypothetical protein